MAKLTLKSKYEDMTKEELITNYICMLLNISDVLETDDWSKKLMADLKSYDEEDMPISNGH